MNAAVLPKQVQAQLEAAEQLQQEMMGQAAAPDEGHPAAQDPPPPAAPEPTQPAEPAEPPREPARDAAYWQKRFETMEGKYKAEVAPLHQQVHALTKGMEQLQSQLETASQAQAPKEPEKAKLVTAQDEDKFGSDLIELMRRAARDELSSFTSRLDGFEKALAGMAPQVQRVKQVEQEVVQSRQERFWSELAKEVPDWEQVNGDDRWLAWLGEVDPVIGKARNEALQEAQAKLDYQRVAAIFKLFKSTLPAAKTDQPRNDLARQVAPSKSSTASVPPQGAKKYTAADYAYWLDPRRANDTDKPVREQMLAEMERAFAEGRIAW